MLLVEMPSTFKPEPMSATAVRESATQNRATERHITLLLSIMFLIGMLMMCVEVVKWWKRRMAQYGPPPLANLISYIPGPERLWRATQSCGFLSRTLGRFVGVCIIRCTALMMIGQRRPPDLSSLDKEISNPCTSWVADRFEAGFGGAVSLLAAHSGVTRGDRHPEFARC